MSDWRNIAYHHTYSIDNTGSIKCTYGKENKNVIVLSMQELENYAHKIIRSANALYIGRCIFLFDYIDSMPQNSAIETVSFRQNLCCEQFKDWYFVAKIKEKIIGAVWVRIMNDYGHINDETPSFAMSLYEEYRNLGVGTALICFKRYVVKYSGKCNDKVIHGDYCCQNQTSVVVVVASIRAF